MTKNRWIVSGCFWLALALPMRAFDSLDGINILFALEGEFDLDIPDDAARGIRTVREMVEGIEKLLAAKSPAKSGA